VLCDGGLRVLGELRVGAGVGRASFAGVFQRRSTVWAIFIESKARLRKLSKNMRLQLVSIKRIQEIGSNSERSIIRKLSLDTVCFY